MIASIAEQMLTPSQQKWMEKIMKLWPSESQSMMVAANWQDTLRSDVGDIFLEWHFSDIPIVEKGFENNVPKEHYNITQAVRDEIDALMDNTTTSLWSLAFNLRNIIHFVGDSHCPVHAVTHYSEEFPNGDQGANSVILDCLNYGYYCANLHKLWDSAVLNYQTPKGRAPLKSDFKSNITRVSKIADDTNLNEIANDLNVYTWVEESHDTAVNYVYPNLVSQLNEEYINKGRQQSDIRISLAGRRLGLILRNFFEKRGEIYVPETTEKFMFFNNDKVELIAWILNVVVAGVIIANAISLYVSKQSSLSSTPLLSIQTTQEAETLRV